MPLQPWSDATPSSGKLSEWKDEPSPTPTNKLLSWSNTPDYDGLTSKYAAQYGLPLAFVNRIRQRESGGTTNPAVAASPAGARGVFQLMPDTFREMGVGSNIEDPEQNIHAGVKYLAQMYQRYHGDEALAAAAYNAGPGAVDRAGGVPHFAETQKYVQATKNAALTPWSGPQAPGTPVPQPSAAPSALPTGPHAKPLDPFQFIQHAIMMAGTNTARGVDAVLGAPQRALAGALTGEGLNPAMHPWNDKQQAALEQKTEQLPGVNLAAGAVGAGGHAIGALSDEIMKRVGHETHNAEFLENVGRTLAAQIVTDPLTYIPFFGELEAAKNARQVWGDVAKAARGSVPVIDKIAKTAEAAHEKLLKPLGKKLGGVRNELDPYLDEKVGKPARLSIEEHNIEKERDELAQSYDILRRHEKEVRAAKTWEELPPDVQQHSMREAWRHGTPEMRQKVETDPRFQFRPTEEDRKLYPQPEGLLDYDPRAEYVTLIDPKGPKSYEELPSMKEIGGSAKQEFAGFEKHARPDKDMEFEDMYNRIRNRWRLGAALVRQRRVDRDTKNFLLQYGGSKIPATEGNVEAIVRSLSYSPKQLTIPGWSNAARQFARAGIQINPLPHGVKNVGELTELAGGPEAFGKGLNYAAKGLSKEQQARLSRMGVSIDYLRHSEGSLDRFIEKATAPQQALLTRLELGYRQALLDKYDKEMGFDSSNLALEYQKAQKIRDALGDYRNISAFASALQALGGPFVAFRLGIVPKAVGRAAIKAPGRVENIERSNVDVNQELKKEHQPSSFHYGDPIEDASRLAFKPWDYLTSPASLGPAVAELLKMVQGKESLETALKHAGVEMTPGVRTAMPILEALIPQLKKALVKGGLDYPDTPHTSPFNDALNEIFGTHFERPTTGTQRRAIERKSRQ